LQGTIEQIIKHHKPHRFLMLHSISQYAEPGMTQVVESSLAELILNEIDKVLLIASAISFKIPLAYCVQIPIVSLETKLPTPEVRIIKNLILFKAVK